MTTLPAEVCAYIAAHPTDWEGFHARFPDYSRDAWRAKRNRMGVNAQELLRREMHALAQGQVAPDAIMSMLRQADRSLSMGELVGEQTVVEDASDEDYERLFALIEQVDETVAALSPTQDTTEFHAPDDGLPIGIAFTGDWHLGAAGVESARLHEDLRLIAETPGLYAVAMGDLVEGVNIGVKAASALYSGLLNDGNLQERYALMRLGEAAGKWLALVEGNHDAWMKRASGVGRMDRLAVQLGARGQRPPQFCQGGGTIFAHVGSQRYVVAVTHNAKGNSRINTTNAQRRTFDEWPQWEGCDVICCGHLHYPDRQRAYRKGGFCEYLRSGTYKLRDGYAADNGFKPARGVPLAILYPDRHLAKGWEGDLFEDGVRFLTAERGRYAQGGIAASVHQAAA